MRSLNAFHLNGLRVVEAVARRGSLQAAAAELGVSASAVSQQVQRTEKRLGRPLFERTRGGLVPTDFGRLFSARLSAGFRELAQAIALAETERSDTLVISVAPAFASKWLLARLSRHFARHPGVRLRIDATAGLVDLDRSDVEVAIRLGSGNWPGMRAELLLAQEIFPVCAPSIGAKLREIRDLATSWAIEDENAMITWDSWFEAAGVPPVPMQSGARFTDPLLCLESVIAGHGVMLAWQLLAADALADGRLIAPFGVRAQSGLGYWLVTSADRQESRNVRNFKAWIREEIEETMARFGSTTVRNRNSDAVASGGTTQV
ncbi:LysR substrate-binding domain-containing protein [Mesorhizobium sp. 1B3]|uniref:LysR substrate-binding domain-containing protein n=1 Tax=Mesorhizobium sp. 1B3 TaxID=3243599 RepID=UPI003D97FCB0